MTWFIAQRGSRIALVEARSALEAGPLARPRHSVSPVSGLERSSDGTSCPATVGQGTVRRKRRILPGDGRWYGGPGFADWPFDWRGSTLRPATAAEVTQWQAAREQVRATSGLRWRRLRQAVAVAS